MKFIMGRKLAMTQIWVEDKVMAVTPVQAGPCTVTQVKTKARDGYSALQLAYGSRQEKNLKKPQREQYKKLSLSPSHVRELRLDSDGDFQPGDVISVGTFAVSDKVDAIGTSKGKGFQGVVKRHGFHGFRKTHGNKDQERMPGSIGPKGPARVFKGTRMAGRMGGVRVTVSNLEVAAVDEANNILMIKGALPGALNSLVMIKGQGELKVNLKPEAKPLETAEEAPIEEKAPEAEAAPETPAEAPVEDKAQEEKPQA